MIKIHVIVDSVIDIQAKVADGSINGAKLFGIDGGTGTVVQITIGKISLDGTQAYFRTNSGQEREGEPDALQYFITRLDEEGFLYTLYSSVPCKLHANGIYTPLPDPTDWGNSELTSIFVELKSERWTISNTV